MNYLIENWYMIIGFLALLGLIITVIYRYIKLPNSKQIEKVKAWLLLAVVNAEKELGEKTGRLKLRYVYDLFITRFKWISIIISFEMFSTLVDEALEEMRAMLAANKAVSQYVEKK
ncbi:hypothetical protein KDN24_06045 [Bacillus sp. Bva_UNVM-123]|uniref:hypothetical protein n=1 Tax=Bacillus sp. Bva_UNVM-123 TaxID=2829798 RepID=UPI00391EE69D